MLQPFNYHTHTFRCRHAEGEDREYVEAAIKAGYKILGFSDHCPWVYEDGFVSTMRMAPGDVEGYFHSLETLRDEYKNEIQIFIGFESEYVPELMEGQDRLLSDFPLDYMILGQHFLGQEHKSVYLGAPLRNDEILHRYVDTVIEGVKTGKYLYVAHPDVIHFIGSEKYYETEMTRLCTFLMEADMPIEINQLGAADGRQYPSDRFFQIAKKIGNTCIVGIDAHAPHQLLNKRGSAITEEFIQKHSLPLLQAPPLS
ncbi:MAG: histidinol-phosphatase [Lachnospiraceae bacterium]|nr:histidinol-phosphatase [Lachnospiraceae bacterium]